MLGYCPFCHVGPGTQHATWCQYNGWGGGGGTSPVVNITAKLRAAEIRGMRKALELIETKFTTAQIEYSIPMRYDILDALRDEIKRLEDPV